MPDILTSILKSGEAIRLAPFAACLGTAIVCGILAALAAGIRSHISRSMTVSIILLAPVVSATILMAQNDIATGLAVLGAVSLVRFRSVPGKARDIVAIFVSLTAGVACANGYIALALIVTAVIGAGFVILSFIPLPDDRECDLRITIPETLDFTGIYDDLFAEYTRSHRLVNVRTSNMGSLYRLQYRVVFRDMNRVREFIDKARCRNGNLEISVGTGSDTEEL